jgi:hypothetical protein
LEKELRLKIPVVNRIWHLFKTLRIPTPKGKLALHDNRF